MTTATCARSELTQQRQALAPLQVQDNAAWAPLGSRCACRQFSCQAGKAVATEQTPPPKPKAVPAWGTPEKSQAPPSIVAASSRPCAVDDATLTAAACRLLDEAVIECPMQAAKHMFGAIYHSISVPDLSASIYLTRHLLRLGLALKEDMTEATLLHTLVLLERLHKRQYCNGFHLCSANVHRVLLALMVISTKLVDDEPYTNTYWASVGGVDLPHLNDLEIYSMKVLDHRLNVSATEMDSMRARLVNGYTSAAA